MRSDPWIAMNESIFGSYRINSPLDGVRSDRWQQFYPGRLDVNFCLRDYNKYDITYPAVKAWAIN
jgi:hypothetical protein